MQFGVAWFPAASVAVHMTSWVLIIKTLPDGGVHAIVGATPVLSVANGSVQDTILYAIPAPATTSISDGQVSSWNCGASVSKEIDEIKFEQKYFSELI